MANERVKIREVHAIGSGNYNDRVGRCGTIENLELFQQFILRYDNDDGIMVASTVSELYDKEGVIVVVTESCVYYLERME